MSMGHSLKDGIILTLEAAWIRDLLSLPETYLPRPLSLFDFDALRLSATSGLHFLGGIRHVHQRDSQFIMHAYHGRQTITRAESATGRQLE